MVSEKTAVGQTEIRKCVETLLDGLKESGSKLEIQLITESSSSTTSTSNNNYCIVEWKVIPEDGRKGVHVCEFEDSTNLIYHVKVFSHPKNK